MRVSINQEFFKLLDVYKVEKIKTHKLQADIKQCLLEEPIEGYDEFLERNEITKKYDAIDRCYYLKHKEVGYIGLMSERVASSYH
ncbi:hypothetical protein [Paenibacillus xylaniclasticus]|uniref:hypothetical protein n=1 Tax=Paenibacillus xylaniclasticus TaxID=588083 RepID=UPI000FD91A8B|nr:MULTISPECIES: hypothetical protein [Paenibacillus]GFN32524.1 hypothetical protein PCURB6_27840 [Paenibacillus curdlanolyticus]